MAIRIDYAYLSHMGKVRANNEDNFWCCGKYLPAENNGTDGVQSGCLKASGIPLFAVFDGMGGESCGEIAAHLSAETCGRWYQAQGKKLGKDPEGFFTDGCREMNRAVCAYAKENKVHSMGSTAALLAFDAEYAYLCNLGDSRIYEIWDGKLEQVSVDHVLKGHLFGKAPLLQYVGVPEESMLLEPGFQKRKLKDGSRYLICSDGVSDMICPDELERLLSQKKPMSEIAENVCEGALSRGGRDNITLIVMEATEEKKNHFSDWFEKHRKGRGKGDV